LQRIVYQVRLKPDTTTAKAGHNNGKAGHYDCKAGHKNGKAGLQLQGARRT